jgi:hypothetical protein
MSLARCLCSDIWDRLRGAIQFVLRPVLLGYVSLKDFFKPGPEAIWSFGIIFVGLQPSQQCVTAG